MLSSVPSSLLGPGASEAAVYSLGRALVLAGARLLQLDCRELDAELKPHGEANLASFSLYDTVPGGAGHSEVPAVPGLEGIVARLDAQPK